VSLTSILRPGGGARVCAGAFGSFAAGHWPPACWRPYGADSPFNTPIPPNPRLARESSAIVGYAAANGWSFSRGSSHDFFLDADGSRPVYWARAGDPLVKVLCRRGGSCPRGMRLRIPAGATPQKASDGHMTVIDQAASREFDFWRASPPANGVMSVVAASSIPIGAGSGSGLGGKAEAAQLGLLGGLVRAPELTAGSIEHALAATAPCVQYRDVWPAPPRSFGDAVCGARGPGPHLGSLIQLNMSDAEIASSGAPAWQRAIMVAMADYGIYVVDTNGPGNLQMSIIKEDDLSFTSFGYRPALHEFVDRAAHQAEGEAAGESGLFGMPIPLSRLRVIAPCVPQRRC
jgi:hypothetical protein